MGRDRWVGPNRLNLGQIQFCLLRMAPILKRIWETYLAAS